MGVKAQHKDYSNMLLKWQRCIDVCAGQDAVHNGGITYLPQLKDQDQTSYEAMRDRTPFYNATWRTVVGLKGMVFRVPPTVTVPDLITPMLDNIDMGGTPLNMFAEDIVEELLTVGRVGIWIDYPLVTDGVTLADATRLNLRPSMKKYTAPAIINWKTAIIDNKTLLSMVVLKEIEAVPKDEFEDEDRIQYRVLDLAYDPNTRKRVYRTRLYIVVVNENGQEEDKLIDGPNFPRINGKNLEEIPFQFVNIDDVDWDIDEPPLIDLVDMNLSHYRTTADYEHGCHFTGLPTPVITGFTPEIDGQKFYIGSMTAWVFPRPDAKAFYLEFTGQGLSCLENNLARKESYMAILGARMLAPEVKGAISATTAQIHRAGEQSTLSMIAESMSVAFEKVLSLFCKFGGAGDTTKVKFALNKDFYPIPMDALTITALIAGWQNGAYSQDTLHKNLQDAEIIPQERTMEEEIKLIKANPPPMQDAPTTPGAQKGTASAGVHSPKANNTPATPAPTITQLQNKQE